MPFRQIKFPPKTDDISRSLQLVQDNVAAAINPILASPLASSQYIDSVSLSSGVNKVEHKLGRAVRGYIITSSSSPSTFSDTIASKPSDGNLYITLTTSAATTCSLLVF